MKPATVPSPGMSGEITQGGPVIDFDSLERDFGRQVKGVTLEHAFKVYNRGTEDLVIESAKST